MSRILRSGTILPIDGRTTPVTLLADVEVVDAWRNDDHFAGWLWLANPANLELHAKDLAVLERDEDVEGVMRHRVYDRTYGNNATVELKLKTDAVVAVEPLLIEEAKTAPPELPADILDTGIKPKAKAKK